MVIGEIVARITNLYEKGVPSRSSRLSPRHVYNKMLTVRSKLIRQEANKKQKINQWNYQTIPCLELEKTTIHNCPCIPPIGCYISKSKYPLPKPINNLDNHLIQYVSSIDGSVVFSEISWLQKKYKSGNKYTSKKPDYFIKDGYLYITHSSKIKI
ncbi:MAG: hypothetical protein ACRC0V_09705, partial [Fusobacteriaceae bacterium]